MRNYLILILTCLWLTSCATVQPAPKLAQNESMDWGQRVHTLNDVQKWNLHAQIALRQLHTSQAWSANLQWSQQKQNYHIALFGPLGTNSYELNGRPGNVELSMADGKHFTATSPETLLAKQTGWSLPVSNLYYWIRGLPVPSMSADKQFDNYYHLTVLKQDGWTIQYLRYTSVDRIDIPSKIFLNNPDLNVKIVISQWDI